MGKKYAIMILMTFCAFMIFAAVSCEAKKDDGGGGGSYTDYFSPGANDFYVKSNQECTLPAGTYYFTSMTIKGKVNASGDVVIYCTGDIDLGGSGIVNTAKPADLVIYSTGDDVAISGNSDFYGTVYAPDADIKFNGTTTTYGGVVGKLVTIVGTADIHYDEALNGTGSPSIGKTVCSWIEK